MRHFLYILFVSFFYFSSFAQNDSLNTDVIINGDTLSSELLDEVTLMSSPQFSSYETFKKYYILKKKIIKVYPYAILASNKIDSLYNELGSLNKKREEKKLIKQREQFLKEEFGEQLKNLSRTEGVILVKLIYREKNRTVHSYIKEFKSGFIAGFWQIAAKIYDNNLKEEYHPDINEEDALIEQIIKELDL